MHMLPNLLAKYRPLWSPDDPVAPPGGTPTPDDPARGTPTPEVVVAPAPAAPEPSPTPDPLQQRMNTLTAQRWAEKRRADEAEARARLAEETLTELRRLEAPDPAAPPGGTPPARTPAPARAEPPGTVRVTPQEHADAVRREAMAQAYNARVNETVSEGRKVHKDFDEKIVALKSLTGDVVPPDFVVAAMETGRGADILHALGSDLAEADRILQLPLARQAVELTRLADKLPKGEGEGAATPPAGPARRAADVSRAPPPIASRVGGGAAPRDPAIDSPEAADPDRGLSTAEWIKRRNADVAAKRKDGQVSLR